MSISSIVPFINIKISHSFYQQDKMPDLRLFPMPKTRVLLKKMGIFFKLEDNSFSLGYTKEKTLKHFETETAINSLIFGMKNQNPHFQNITDIGIYSPQAKFFLFSNLVEDKIKAGGQPLHQQEKVSKVDLVDLEKAAEWNKNNIPDLMVQNTMDHYFGLIHIGLTKKMMETQGTKHEIQWNYSIKFKNCSTKWRYLFLNPNKQFKALEIKENGATINFPLNQEVQLMDGTKAWQITLKGKRPLCENYANLFSTNLITHSEMRIPISLPYPSAQNIRTVREDKILETYADMYVYL